MSDLRDRVQEIVTSSGLTKAAFGERLGVSGAYIGMICAGKAIPADRTIVAICKEFNINEVWLRTGEGSKAPDNSLMEDIGRMIAEVMADLPQGEQEEVTRALVRMGPAGWKNLILFLTEFKKSLDENRSN